MPCNGRTRRVEIVQLDQTALRTGDGTTNNHDTFFTVYFDHTKVFNGHACVPHVARHFLAFENLTRLRTATDGTAVTEILVRPVRCAKTSHVVSLHHAGKPAAFADTRDVQRLAIGKDVGVDGLAHFVLSQFFFGDTDFT